MELSLLVTRESCLFEKYQYDPSRNVGYSLGRLGAGVQTGFNSSSKQQEHNGSSIIEILGKEVVPHRQAEIIILQVRPKPIICMKTKQLTGAGTLVSTAEGIIFGFSSADGS